MPGAPGVSELRGALVTDRDVVALTLYGEARGESLEGQLAVASVLLNRRADGRWGQTFTAVCRAPWQFSCWNVTDPNRATLNRLAADLEHGTVTDAALRRCLWLADGVVAGVLPSSVRRATHYYATSLRDTPKWAKTGTLVGRVGNHLFFEHVA